VPSVRLMCSVQSFGSGRLRLDERTPADAIYFVLAAVALSPV
jgi:hypothetical protein